MQPVQHGSATMEINGLKCDLHAPEKALTSTLGSDGEEIAQGLPPSRLCKTYSVDVFDEHCPADWPRSDHRTQSVFTGLQSGNGLWLDFGANMRHTHDVAIVVSVQGVNALTAQKVTLDSLRLEQYRVNCPTHRTPLGADRYCKDCKYKVPPQNYLTTAGNPHHYLWLDGYRTDDGTVRQFKVTTDASEGVAAQLIAGARNYRLSICYYTSKKPKPVQQYGGYRSHGGAPFAMNGPGLESMGPQTLGGATSMGGRRRSATKSIASKNLEIGAGARISQDVHQDPNEVSYWNEQPSGILFINYVDVETAKEIIGLGARKEDREGPFGGIRSGHNPNPFLA